MNNHEMSVGDYLRDLDQKGSKSRKSLKSSIMTAEQYRQENVDQEEHDLQALCVKWFRLAYPQLKLVAIPNGGLRDPVTAAQLKEEGVERGVPDLILFYPCGQYHALLLEMKTVNGEPSPEQLLFHAYLRSMDYDVSIPRTFEAFQEAIQAYLSLSD